MDFQWFCQRILEVFDPLRTKGDTVGTLLSLGTSDANDGEIEHLCVA